MTTVVRLTRLDGRSLRAEPIDLQEYPWAPNAVASGVLSILRDHLTGERTAPEMFGGCVPYVESVYFHKTTGHFFVKASTSRMHDARVGMFELSDEEASRFLAACGYDHPCPRQGEAPAPPVQGEESQSETGPATAHKPDDSRKGGEPDYDAMAASIGGKSGQLIRLMKSKLSATHQEIEEFVYDGDSREWSTIKTLVNRTNNSILDYMRGKKVRWSRVRFTTDQNAYLVVKRVSASFTDETPVKLQ